MKFKLTVIGNPIAHSKSPWIHAEFAKQNDLDVFYDKTESPLDGFKATVLNLQANGYNGANVTAPFKEEAYQLSDSTSERAKIARAANILKFLPDRSMYADNADGAGFITDIQTNHGYALKNKKILILGAGGGVRGILHPILQTNPSTVIITNRTESRAKNLADEFSLYGEVLSKNFNDLNDDYDVIIDGTSFNAWPLPISDKIFAHCSLVYDIKYGNKFTPILKKASSCDVKQVLDGFGMLVEQAAEAFALWTGYKPNTAPILEHAKQILD
ncbi:MAG: shikimate dehydrogenase [Gammaproteobacteria bacterium]|nr:shikimate dehydrogenase [Gammaproteobacteria bacterium]MBY0545504.1 shikimate dehydrogenase [Gammaproteobacteria bacterium]